MCVFSQSRVRHFGIQWPVASQAALSMGLPRQEGWSELPFPSPGDLPDPGIKLVFLTSLALAGRFTTEPPGKPSSTTCYNYLYLTLILLLKYCLQFLSSWGKKSFPKTILCWLEMFNYN